MTDFVEEINSVISKLVCHSNNFSSLAVVVALGLEKVQNP
jgi:hypothetical protein